METIDTNIKTMSDDEVRELNKLVARRFLKHVAIRTAVYTTIAVAAHVIIKKLDEKNDESND
jgi:hypothetical protein